MLGDCHIHMVLDGVYYKDAIAAHRGHVRDDLIRSRLQAYADAGIHFLRDGGDAFGVCLRARELSEDYGIEYRIPCFPICLKGRYGMFIGRAFETMAEYRSLIGCVQRQKGNFIKLMISGLMDFNHYGQITSEPLSAAQIKEMISIAHGEGFRVMAHANGAQTIADVLEAGVDSIEHGAYMDGETLRLLAQSGAVWVPTLSTIGNLIGDGRYPDDVLRRILDLQLRNLALCSSLGGLIALGSDAGAYRVCHVRGAMTEKRWLSMALGEKTDEALLRGEEAIRRLF